MRRTFVAAALLLAACAQQEAPAQLVLSGTFDPKEVKWSEKAGRNAVSGFAVLRTAGGEGRTCAGLKVYLIPDSEYAREHMLTLFGELDHAMRAVDGAPTLEPANDEYLATVRTTRCDGQGYFSFERVPDGKWYVVTLVVWVVSPPFPVQGSYMMKQVELRRGQSVKVALPST